MKNILGINQLDKNVITSLLSQSSKLKRSQSWPTYPNINIASLFYENSTRTKISFELATKQLNMKHISVDLERSSEEKGEAILDTIRTLHAMGIGGFVFRHAKEKLIHELSQAVPTARFVNAGDGMHEHPTQTLTDLFTIQQKKEAFNYLKVVIVGDIKHSRVANSLISGLSLMGVSNIFLSAPAFFLPERIDNTIIENQLDKALDGADVVVALRVQKERIKNNIAYSIEDYIKSYRLDESLLSKAKSDVILMHPGPMNRGIELTSKLCDGEQSVILEQVQNSIFVRMAVLQYIFDLI